jgi:uncharacterized protein
LQPAAAAFDFILARMSAPHGGVQHAWRLGRVTAAGMIDDQAAMARAGLALYEATGDAAYLTHALRLVEAAEQSFADGQGGFYTTAADATDVPVVRPRTAADNATPAGNGLIAEVFARLYHLTGDPAWRQRTEAVLRAFSGELDQLSGMPTLLAAADLLEEGASVVIAGDPVAAEPLLRAALAAPDPAVVVLRAPTSDALPQEHPAFGKTAGSTGAAAYVCRGNVCGLPVTGADGLAATLRARGGVSPP